MKLFASVSAALATYIVVMVLGLASAVGGSSSLSGGAFSVSNDLGLSPEQLHNATTSLQVADEERAPPLAVLAMMVGALGESNLLVVFNAQGSGYCGVYQADPSNIACDDTRRQAQSFQRGGLGFQAGGAIHLATTQPDLTPGTIATLVEASGQPGSFYDAHLTQAEQIIAAWRSGSADDGPSFGGSAVGPLRGEWLATVPGTKLQCDRRIIADVVALVQRYHLLLTACYAPSGHAAGGEHPLGLAIDAVPQTPYSWSVVNDMVHDLGWRETCASTGCADQTGDALRFIGWNGYPGHGDPAHAGANAHVHLSWQHGPGRPAQSVKVLTD